MRKIHLLFLTAAAVATMFAAEAKWVHATSAHFDLYTTESEGDAKGALNHLEQTRAYFLAATHFHDPGGQPVRIVAFHADSDYARYKPADVRSGKAYGVAARPAPATIVLQGLKPEMFEQAFREYTQLVLDDSAPTLPYWFRAGLSTFYSTLKPGDNTMSLGASPRGDFRNGEVGNVSLPLLFGVDRDAFLASREKARSDFNTTKADTGSFNGQSSSAGSRDPNGGASVALNTAQSTMSQSQDFARSAWMLVHMLMFQPEYRPKFGEFMRTLAGGTETGAALVKVYDRPISKVKSDLTIYANQTGIMVAAAPFKIEKPPSPEIRPATKEELDRIFADLSKRP